jgi:hypothetical protein
MKMKIAALVLVVLLPVLAVTATYATKPAVGTGKVTLVSQTMVGSPRTAGDNTITTFKNTFHLTGALTGIAVALERDVTHSSGDKSAITFQGDANFTGTAGDLSGKLVIRYVGVNNGTFIRGQFVTVSGTGGLADFHGQGEFSGKVGMGAEGGGLPLDYTLKWHIDPSVVRTKHSA